MILDLKILLGSLRTKTEDTWPFLFSSLWNSNLKIYESIIDVICDKHGLKSSSQIVFNFGSTCLLMRKKVTEAREFLVWVARLANFVCQD